MNAGGQNRPRRPRLGRNTRAQRQFGNRVRSRSGFRSKRSPSASDRIALPSSTLTLTGQQFSDFDFNAESGFGGTGTYTLIDADSIQGSLGSDLTGMIGNYPASLSTSGGNLVLTVAVPK